MPPKRGKSGKGKGKGKGKVGKRGKTGTKKAPVEKLLEEAIQKSYVGFFEDANTLFERALSLQPTNVEILDAYAENCLDAGASDRAKELLETSVSLTGGSNFQALFYLGQLTLGEESVDYYRRGIQVVLEKLEGIVGEQEDSEEEQDSMEAMELKETLSKAYVSIADTYLTDLCFNEDAELQCENAVVEALRWSPESVEGLQTKASLRISQQRPEEGKEAILRSYAQWKEIDPAESEDEYPSYDFRIGTVRIMLEVGAFDDAVDVILNLLAEDEAMVQSWILLVHAMLSTSRKEVAQTCLLWAFFFAAAQEFDIGDPSLVEHMNELSHQLGVEPSVATASMSQEDASEFLRMTFDGGDVGEMNGMEEMEEIE